MRVRDREILPMAAVGRWKHAKLPMPVGMPPIHSELWVPSLRAFCSPINPSTDTCCVWGLNPRRSVRMLKLWQPPGLGQCPTLCW